MKKTHKIWQIDAFTTKAFKGNSAAVTFGSDIKREDKFEIAKEMNLAETAFLSPSDKADYQLQWFTPTVEVELCGHATIASLHFLKEHDLLTEDKEIRFETLSGILNCKYSGGKYFMKMPVRKIKQFTGDLDGILDALGIPPNGLDPVAPPVILDNENLYICVKSLSKLHLLQPDFKALKSISASGTAGGYAIFTLDTIEEENFAHVRYFAPHHGIDEDPVTGSVNGPLIQVLLHHGIITYSGSPLLLTFEQGDVLNRSGRVHVSFDPAKEELYISGEAVTVLKGEICF